MEYVQMTLNDWVQMKQKLKQELLGVKQSFVRIGYALRKIEDQRLYEQDGYKSIAEFAKAEYGLEPSTTSRFMSINREYSVDGYSETLRPEFADLGRSQLEEMLKLPDSDRQMIQPETSREDIRELKRFNKTEPAAGVADDIRELVGKFFRDNTEILRQVFQEDMTNIKKMVEIINPSGNRSYKKGLYFLMMYENKIALKKFGGTPQEMTWEEFLQITQDIFGGRTDNLELFGGTENAGEGDGTDGDVPGGTETGDTGALERTEGSQEGDVPGERERNQANDGEEDGTKEDGTTGEEKGQEGCGSTPGGASAEPAGAESQGEEIAPAQKTPKILEEEGFLDDEKEDDATGETTDQDEEPETEMAAGEETEETAPCSEIMNAPEIVDKPFGTRKDYMDTLTAYGMAMYIAQEYKEHSLKASSLAFPSELEKWLLEEVDSNGRTWIGEGDE